MQKSKLNLLYIEDNLTDFLKLDTKLRKLAGKYEYSLIHCLSLAEAEKQARNNSIDIFLLDLSLPDAAGIEGLHFLTRKFPSVPVVTVSSHKDNEAYMDSIKAGAQDNLIKGEFSGEMILRVCENAIERKKINTQLSNALQTVEGLNKNLNEVNEKLAKTVDRLQTQKTRTAKKKRQMNAFISTFIHELKNPVSAINSLTEILMRDADNLTIPQLKFINQIKYSSSSMLDNILTIIQTTSAEEGRNPQLNIVFENPFYTMNAAIDKFIIDAIQRNVLLEIGYIKELPSVYFDKRILVNAIAAILKTHINHSADNTRLSIQCELNVEKDLKVSFESKGFTLDVVTLNQFIEGEFEELDARNKELLNANISLSLAKKYIEIMGGEIGVNETTDPNKTSIWFTLKSAKMPKNETFKQE
ncbi:response regulator [Flammeovirgaceae bacterium SG7u.111]|nr:response regulator [Flammeovirgaceae bacterium SG7u.132]WPO35303.1 response regulator [Flammeovirgaceae bacterium SG7u.111]